MTDVPPVADDESVPIPTKPLSGGPSAVHPTQPPTPPYTCHLIPGASNGMPSWSDYLASLGDEPPVDPTPAPRPVAKRTLPGAKKAAVKQLSPEEEERKRYFDSIVLHQSYN